MVLGLVLRCEDRVEFVKMCNLSIDYICYLVGKINLLNQRLNWIFYYFDYILMIYKDLIYKL